MLLVLSGMGAIAARAKALVLPVAVPPPGNGPSSLASPPRLIGDGVAWVVGDGAGRHYVLRTDPGPTTRTLTTLPALPRKLLGISFGEMFDLRLSDQAIGVSRFAESCADETACKYQVLDLVDQDIVFATPGGVPMSVAGCAPTLAAHDCRDIGACSESVPSVALSGDAVAYSDSACDSRSATVNLREISGASRSFPGGPPFAMAGPYLADTQQVTTSSGAQAPVLVVYDWTTGAERERVTAPGLSALAIQPDGTLAVLYAGGGGYSASRLAWASLAQPHLHDLGSTTSRIVRIAADHLVTDEVTVDSPSIGSVVERGLDGTVIQQGAVPALAQQIDFDGDRFAYPLTPCELSDVVVTSSLAQPVPRELPSRCPVPTFATSKIYLRHSRLTTRVACPAQPYLGCAGSLHLLASRGRTTDRGRARAGKFLGYANYELDPGQSGSVSARLGRRARHFLIRHPRLAVIARATSVKPFDHTTLNYPATVTQTTLALAR